MFGGPWLGVIAFIVIAIGMGWGVAWFFKQAKNASDAASPTAGHSDTLVLGFDPDTVYLLQRDLLLGYTSDGRKTLFPSRDDLPKDAYGRRSSPTLDDVRRWTAAERGQHDLIGIVERGTAVRVVELIEDPGNAQTRILALVELMDGPYASRAPVLGMHVESVDIHEETGEQRAVPRPDLFTPAEPAAGPVQSPVPAPNLSE